MKCFNRRKSERFPFLREIARIEITEIDGLEDSMNKTIYVCRRELVLKRQKELGLDVNDFKWPYAADGREVRFDNPNDPDTGSIEGTGFLIAREWCEEVEAGT